MLNAWTCWGLGPGPSACKTVVIVRDSSSTRAKSTQYVPGSKLPMLGMVIPTLVRNPCNGCINPYYWVDDPSTYEDCETCMDIIQPLHRPGHNVCFGRFRQAKLLLVKVPGFDFWRILGEKKHYSKHYQTIYSDELGWRHYKPWHACIL